uniref:U1740p n=1 Tax=Mycobacterium leprae TaxID=1769 RepID=Q50075_MYCLR|nr:u1740p [Mycobacterium leprae]
MLVGNGFGADSLTEFGYTRPIKRWCLNTPLADAKTSFEDGKLRCPDLCVRRSNARLRMHLHGASASFMELEALRTSRLGAA